MTNEIEALKKRVAELEKQLGDTRKLLHNAECEVIGIAVGDLVKDSREREFKVSRIEIWSYSKQPSASLYGFKKTKEDWSIRDQYIGTAWTKL